MNADCPGSTSGQFNVLSVRTLVAHIVKHPKWPCVEREPVEAVEAAEAGALSIGGLASGEKDA